MGGWVVPPATGLTLSFVKIVDIYFRTKEAMIIKKLHGLLVIVLALTALLIACGRKGPDSPPDNTPPTIIATDPGITNNAGVPPDAVVSVTFSETVDPSTILFMLGGGGSTIPCDRSYSGKTAVFTPQSPLALNTPYIVLVSAGVKDSAGNAMTNDYSWSFMTGKAPTTMQISAPDVTYNANGIVTVTVSATVGTPIGEVSLSVDSGVATKRGLTGGSATFTIQTPSAGTHTLNATYAAQGDHGASSASGALVVNRAATTMNITAPGVTYGEDGIVTMTVRSNAGTPTGNVSLSVDDGAATTQALVGGSATFTISSPTAGPHSLSATYAAQGNFAASSATGTLGVGPKATSMTLNALEVRYNADGNVTVTVSSAAVTPTGDVSLRVDNGPAITQTLVGGSTIFTITSPSAGTHTLNAAYAAQGNFGASSASGDLIVNQAATTTNIDAPSVTYGEEGIVTVTVSAPAGVPTPTGDVSLIVDNGAATTKSLSSGSAIFRIQSLTADNHTLNAAYAAQGNYGASSAYGTLGVGAGATSMTITALGVMYDADASVTIRVSSLSGTPEGDVSLNIDSGATTTKPLSNGSATFTITSPDAGPHTLNAAYDDAQGNYGACSASEMLIVNQAATTTNIDAPSVTYGEDGNVTVTVSAGTLTPTGDVSLSVDGGAAATQTLVGGSATFTISSPSAGSHTLRATYAAQGNYGYSEASGTLGVDAGTSMTISAPDVIYGSDGIVTVKVSSILGIPTGDVLLSVNGAEAITQTLDGGTAMFTISHPGTGDYTLNAAYAAQGIYAASFASGMLKVNKAVATVSLSSSSNPSIVGDLVTFTATVSSSAGILTVPTGTVTFKDGGAILDTVALSDGTATYSTLGLAAGFHSITAEYSGDANFTASTSSTLEQEVQE
jgi:predicted small lipoprotein YifL